MDKTLPILSAIVAMADNHVIGINNQLPWRLPADLKHFKAITTGHPIIMGRKTYESIGKPLPNRTNIVISRNKQYNAPGCVVVTSLAEAMTYAQENEAKEIFVIGGAEIYQQALPLLHRIYMTIVHQNFKGDAYFPALDPAIWREVERRSYGADAENEYAYSFVMWEKFEKELS